MSDELDGRSETTQADQRTIWLRIAEDPVEQLAAELRSRWQRGDRPTIEQLEPGFRELAKDEEALLDLIYHEVLVREQFGERPSPAEYAERFPALGDRVLRLLEIHREMDDRVPDDRVPDHAAGRATMSAARSGDTEFPTAPPDFEILQELGRGGMAVVYRARQLSLDRIVALKVVATALAASPEMLPRFRQEAQAAAQLHHPNFVQIYEVGQFAGRPYLALEYVSGGTLQRRLDGRPLTSDRAARLIETLARAVHYAHRRGIVHRDLKPANILLEPLDGLRPESPEANHDSGIWLDDHGGSAQALRPKISDFGLAKAAQCESHLTITGQVLGTPSYMSPEQTTGQSDAIAAASDVYSLGAILYQLLTGRPPFLGKSMLDVLEQVRSEPPRPPRHLQPDVPRDLETICLHCLEKSPQRRYATAEHLADDLRRFLNHVPISVRPSGWLERGVKWVRRRPAVAGLSLAVAVSLLGGLIGVGWQSYKANVYAARASKERDHVRRLHAAATAERDRAAALRVEAERQARIATALQADAERNFQRAFEAVNGIRRLGTNYYQQPEHTPVGRELLQFTLQYYEGFLSDDSSDPRVRAAAAEAFSHAGDIVASLGERERAVEFFRRAIRLGEQLSADQPGDATPLRGLADSWRKLGNSLRHLDRCSESEVAYRKAIEQYQRAVELIPRHRNLRVTLANTHTNLSATLWARRHIAEAVAQCDQAEKLLRALAAGPANDYIRTELAICLDDQGELLLDQGAFDAANRKFDEAFALRRRLHQAKPDDAVARRLLSRSFVNLSRIGPWKQQWDTARKHAESAVALLEKLAEENPARLDMQQEYPTALNRLAALLLERDAAEEAERPLREALRIREQMAARFPEDLATMLGLASQQSLFGAFLWDQQRTAEARSWLERAASSSKAVYERWPNSPRAASECADFLANCPAADLRDVARALELSQRAVGLDPDDARSQSTFGVVSYRAKDWSGAIESLSKSVRISGGFRTDFLFLALAHHARNETADAATWLQRYDDSPAPLGVFAFQRRRWDEEVRDLRIPPASEDR